MNKIFNFLFFTAFYIGGIFASDFEFEADKTFLDSENESLILEGNVSLKFDEFLFEAKKITLDKILIFKKCAYFQHRNLKNLKNLKINVCSDLTWQHA